MIFFLKHKTNTLSAGCFCVFVPESDSEVAEELLKPGHLSRLLEEDLSGDISCLSLTEVIGDTERLLERLRSYRDACSARHLGVSFSFILDFFFFFPPVD